MIDARQAPRPRLPRPALALLLACGVALAPPGWAQSRQQVEGTLAAAVTQLTDQYVDPLDSRALAVHGLRALAALPGASDEARKASLAQAVQAEDKAAGITPQTRILADEILRFAAGAAREAALDAALRGMLASLDANSRVATRAEMAPPPASVGLEMSIQRGVLTVERPLPGSPGERAGIQAGDIITRVDGHPTAGLPLPEAVALLRGAVGTRPIVEIQRPGVADALVMRPVRGPVQAPPSVRWERDGAVAVIRISAFNSQTGALLRDALDTARSGGGAPLAGVVLDLRGNAGGLLEVTEQVAGMVLAEGTRVGSLRGRTPANAVTLVARHSRLPHDVPMVVLIDRRTGAGAEIVAAALQDHGRGLLIGEKTAGAGTIQTVLPLPDNQGALVVTSARVHRANGATLERDGVTPDMRLDGATGRITLRAEIAADFNQPMAQRIRAALAAAPAGTDLARLAALTALRDAGQR